MKTDIYKLLTGRIRITGESIMGPVQAQLWSDHIRHSIERAFRYSKDKPEIGRAHV